MQLFMFALSLSLGGGEGEGEGDQGRRESGEDTKHIRSL